MWLYESISKIIPEGKTKNAIRSVFYKVAFNLSTGTYTITFDDVEIKLQNLILLPKRTTTALTGYLLKYKPEKGDVIVDGGSSPGVFAIYCAKKVGPEGKVICFEPDNESYKLLKKNIKLNALDNVIVLRKGMWSKNTELGVDSKGISSSLKEGEGISAVSIDNELKRLNLDKVALIKMDIEGAEIEAVKGCKKTIENSKPHFAIASYHIVDGEQTSKELEKMFKKSGYNPVTEYPDHQTTYA